MGTQSVSTIENREHVLLGDDRYAKGVLNVDGVGGVYIAVSDQDLSLAPLDFTTSETEDFLVNYVYIDFQTPVSETVQVWKTTTGADELLETRALVGNQRIRMVADLPVYISPKNGEQFKITCTNSGLAGVTKTTLKVTVI